MTSLLRELIPVPMASSASTTTTSRPARASARDRETNHAGTDDEAFDGVHGSLQRVGAATLNYLLAPPVRPAPYRRPT